MKILKRPLMLRLKSMPAAKAAADIAKRFDLAKKDIYSRILARKE